MDQSLRAGVSTAALFSDPKARGSLALSDQGPQEPAGRGPGGRSFASARLTGTVRLPARLLRVERGGTHGPILRPRESL